VVRKAAGLRQMVDIGLSDAVTTIQCQKQITVGKSYFEASLITHPMPNNKLKKLLSSVVRIFVIVS